MGYTTDFEGEISISPPLNPAEIGYLRAFSETRHVSVNGGPYRTGDPIPTDVIDYNAPPAEHPGLWCDWEPTESGTAVRWNGTEKFYNSVAWMAYLIDTFLAPGAALGRELESHVPGRWYAPEFAEFTFDHVLNGRIEAQGERDDDRWVLVVENNTVSEVPAGPSAEHTAGRHNCPLCECEDA